ncbi:uncharacterized protein LOC109062036 isoform X6 [Cyprinus carpio]|uniref:Uncharacterized protein LOC109062036 isoform X6 n=1 Tax=Cyprinus carpio TaxID=7962 RepID=A0A9Q9W598_CYPCA|nr:uncharacterized protein LOC109062036 isoform X6 [Cyprinus carpio]
MACAQRSAKEYLRNNRKDLVTGMKNLRLIIENLYQEKVFNDYDVDALKDKKKKFGKARCILDRVIKQGEKASYELLKILDVTKKRTLDPGLHYWISCSPFRDEDTEPSYSFGTKPCKNYQKQLKDKAKEKCFFKYLLKTQGNFSFIPLVLETDSEVKSPQCKINLKSKKCKKLRPKKLRAYIPNEGQAISPEDLLRWQDKNILIIGKPGVGKTTVVQEMLRLWGEKDGREIDYMFYFDQSVLAHSSVASLEALLFDVYSKPMEKDRKEVFQDIEENSENVVIVFDCVMGLEENVILWKIMKHKLLPDAKVVITCRSEEEDDPLFSDWPTRTVYVQGFSEESIKTYYQEMLGNNHVLLDVILKNQELFSLSHVPLYAFMIVDLIKFKNDTVCNHPHTVTEMYIHIFRLAVKKHGNKQNKQMDMYLKEKKDQIDPLMENAFSATKQKCLNLPHISSDETDICHAFLKMITTTDSPTSATTYCAFLHNTMQEFFSALWLLGHPDEIEKVLQLCQTEEHKHMRHVLPFLCGLLSEHNTRLLKCLFPEDQIKKTSDWFIEKLLDTFFQAQSESEEFDLLYVCQCLYELQSPKACLIFLEKMNHQLDLEVDLDPHQCCALSYVIGQSRDKEVYLNLDNCTVADVGMDMMLSCSPNIRLKTCKEPLKQTTFFVEFFHKSSQCDCKLFEVRGRYKPETFNALLDLYSHVKNYETQTGRSYLPALQSVFQSPDEWIIDLSERKSSVLLEVLKLQTEKKTVKLRGCSEEESEVMSFLQCLPHISQLRFWDIDYEERMSAVRFLLDLCVAAVETDRYTRTRFSTLLSSVCSYKTFPFNYDGDDQSDFLLDLYSHVKNYETQTGRSYLPVLQSVFQLPDEWIIDLSERKISVLLEVLKLQTEKKTVELRGCSEEESEVMSFLQCLPHISQLRFWFIYNEERMSAVRFLLNLCVAAVETDRYTGTRFSTLLSSVCSYKTFPFDEEYEHYVANVQSDFLLDLYSHVKNYETQTGRSYLPALQSVFQSPDEWIIDLSERKSSVLLEVLKLQTEKKTVKLRRCSEEESDVMSFLQCLPHISQLRFWDIDDEERMSAVRFLLNLCVAAVETDRYTGTRFSTLLSSVCSYKTFPFNKDGDVQSDFLLDLYSHVKNYETQTGRSYLPVLQSVFQSPDEWIIDLSKRRSSVLLEVLKLQTEKKTVELRGCSEEESEVMSFLQCLPHISQLRFWFIYKESRMSAVRFLLDLCVAAVETDRHTGTRFSTLLSSVCSYKTFPFNKDGDVQIDFLLDLYSHVKNYETQTGRSYLPALQSVFQSPDEWIIDLSERKSSVLLEVLKLQTEKKTVELRGCSEEESEVMSFLQCLPHISQLRLPKETVQKLAECVCEAQEEELTRCFLQKVSGDLTSCSLSWEQLHYFLQQRIQQITVDFRKSNIQCRISEILPFLNRIQFKRMSSSFMLCAIREIYESGSAGFVSGLLSSVENYINLQSRELDSVHCEALRFTLQHCTAASLNLLWTSIPEEELQSILPLFTHLSHLSVDRLLLLKMLHCCSVSDVQQEAASVLLSILQHKLDFSCRSALDLTTNTDSEPLHLTADDCRVTSRFIQRAHSDTKTRLILQDCEIHTAGMDQLFPVLRSVQLCCDKPLLLQFLAHVRPEEAQSLSGALGEELDLSQTQLDPQVWRGLELILEYSEGLTELDLSQCGLTDHSLDLLLPNLHKAQIIDFSGNSITDAGAQNLHMIVNHNRNIKTVRCVSECHSDAQSYLNCY